MWRLTEAARTVIAQSREEARRFNHNYIGTEHLLLTFGRPTARLDCLGGLDYEAIEREIVGLIIPGPVPPQEFSYFAFTEQTKHVFELAEQHSKQRGEEKIDVPDLWWGLLQEGQGKAAKILKKLQQDQKILEAIKT